MRTLQLHSEVVAINASETLSFGDVMLPRSARFFAVKYIAPRLLCLSVLFFTNDIIDE
jgi:hypothetical protein